MLAVARALMLRPRLLLLDEPSLGLAPMLTAELFKQFAELNRQFGTTMFIVEQNAGLALSIAARAYVLEAGHIVLAGSSDELRDHGLRRRGRLADVSRQRRPWLPAAPASRVRDGHVRAAGVHRPLRLARRDRALRSGRRAVAHGRRGHRALRDVPVARPRGPEPVRAVPDLVEPAGCRQDGRALLHDVLGRRHPAEAILGRGRALDGDHGHRRASG